MADDQAQQQANLIEVDPAVGPTQPRIRTRSPSANLLLTTSCVDCKTGNRSRLGHRRKTVSFAILALSHSDEISKQAKSSAYTASLSSSVVDYPVEHGRTYNAFRAGSR